MTCLEATYAWKINGFFLRDSTRIGVAEMIAPRGSSGKNPPANVGGMGSTPESGRSRGGENSNPLQYSCLEKSHEQRSLAGQCPRGHKESDVTEYTRLHTFITRHQSRLEGVRGNGSS